MIIYLAADHAGFHHKEFTKQYLKDNGYVVKDFGAEKFNELDDYPDYIFPCIKSLAKESLGDEKRGRAIIFGGSGTGEAICANRVERARAVVCNSKDIEIIKLGREHNNANVLSIGARFVPKEFLPIAINIFLNTEFLGGKHAKRVMKIDMNL
jgi:ribose 5-phosphate isomerase B